MPGIFGLITKMPRPWAEPQLLRMLNVLRHESFYETGTKIDEPSGVYVGWTARENSFSAGMPLRNERGDVVLIFAGEEYSDPADICSSSMTGATNSLLPDLPIWCTSMKTIPLFQNV
jgi:hypothetical protein